MDRPDLRAKVAGSAAYAADHLPRPLLHARLVPAPSAAASVRVDAAAALVDDDVVLVLGPEDDPAVRWTNNPHGGWADCCVLTASPRWPGEPVAMVVARSRAAAERARARVVVHVDDAAEPSQAPCASGRPTHVVMGEEAERFERALAASPHRFEGTWRFDGGPHGTIERPVAAAAWDETAQRWTVWSCTQTPQLVAARVADVFGLAADDVYLETVVVGGGFGLKEDVCLEPAALLASRRCDGAAVLVEIDRADVTTLRRRFPAEVRVRSGVDHDGTLLARCVEVTIEAGGVHGHSLDVAANGAYLGAAVYASRSTRAVGQSVLTVAPPGAGFRGYGGTEAVAAIEAQSEEIARRLGIDPIRWRLANCLRTGGYDPRGEPVPDLALDECLVALRTRLGARGVSGTPAGGRIRRGVGIACAVDTSGAAQSPAVPDIATVGLRITRGALVVETSVPEIGSGALHALRVTAAESLGISVDDVVVRSTTRGVVDTGVFGSRSAHVVASAVVDAAAALRTELASRGVDLPAALRAPEADGVAVRGVHRSEGPALSAAAVAVEVDVDVATGVVTPRWVSCVLDIGRVLEPLTARGQVHGGVVQGLGVALHERGGGRSGFLDHLMPTARQVPEIDVEFLQRSSPTAPTGAKGLGEITIMAVPAATLNAIADAIGVSPTELPATPERVLHALSDAQVAVNAG